MAKIKLTRNDIEKAIPPLEKNEAIKQSERYEEEYHMSKKELDEIIERLKKLMNELEELEKVDK